MENDTPSTTDRLAIKWHDDACGLVRLGPRRPPGITQYTPLTW